MKLKIEVRKVAREDRSCRTYWVELFISEYRVKINQDWEYN